MIPYPEHLNTIFDTLKKFHIKPVIVGGYIRDTLLHRTSKDIDIELYGINSLEAVEKILKKFGRVSSVGKSFGVCKLSFEDLDLDFSLPRTEEKISSGHNGFKVSTNAGLDFYTASKRRDFTINAIGFDVIEKTLLDPHNGKKDLKSSLLRYVNKESFIEDPLRILRAVQFCSRFSLTMDEALFRLCQEMIAKKMLEELPHERIFEEIKKLLLLSEKPSYGLVLLKEIGAFAYFSEFAFLNKKNWEKTLASLDAMALLQRETKEENITLFLALMTYFLESNASNSLLKKLTNDKKILQNIEALRVTAINSEISNSALMRVAQITNIHTSILLHIALYPEKKSLFLKIKERAKTLNILHTQAKPILQGRDLLALGLVASEKFSKILMSAYEAQMDGIFDNHHEGFLWLKKKLLEEFLI